MSERIVEIPKSKSYDEKGNPQVTYSQKFSGLLRIFERANVFLDRANYLLDEGNIEGNDPFGVTKDVLDTGDRIQGAESLLQHAVCEKATMAGFGIMKLFGGQIPEDMKVYREIVWKYSNGFKEEVDAIKSKIAQKRGELAA